MAIAKWQQILLRGQQSLAVWQQHSPPFTVRGLTLALHRADVNALPPAGQAMAEAQDAVDDARAARDGVLITVAAINTRLPRKLDGDLMPEDSYHGDLEDIRSVQSDSGPAIQTRGQKVVALWKKLNVRNAAAVPVLPPLVVGGRALADFEPEVVSLTGLQQEVEDMESEVRDRRNELRMLAAKADQSNKRWYAAWQGEFPAGTPEGEALGQIETESGGNGGGTGENPLVG